MLALVGVVFAVTCPTSYIQGTGNIADKCYAKKDGSGMAYTMLQCESLCAQDNASNVCIGSDEENLFVANNVAGGAYGWMGLYQELDASDASMGFNQCSDASSNWASYNTMATIGRANDGAECSLFVGTTEGRNAPELVTWGRQGAVWISYPCDPEARGMPLPNVHCLCEFPGQASAAFTAYFSGRRLHSDSPWRIVVATSVSVGLLPTLMLGLFSYWRKRYKKTHYYIRGMRSASIIEDSESRLSRARAAAIDIRVHTSGITLCIGWFLCVIGVGPLLGFWQRDPGPFGSANILLFFMPLGGVMVALGLRPRDELLIRVTSALIMIILVGLSCFFAYNLSSTSVRGNDVGVRKRAHTTSRTGCTPHPAPPLPMLLSSSALRTLPSSLLSSWLAWQTTCPDSMLRGASGCPLSRARNVVDPLRSGDVPSFWQLSDYLPALPC